MVQKKRATPHRQPRRGESFLTRKKRDQAPLPLTHEPVSSRGRRQDPAMVHPLALPQMPQLGQPARLQGVPTAYGMTMQQLQQNKPAEKGTGKDAAKALGNTLWRFRWQLTPFGVTTATVVGAAVQPSYSLAALAITGVAAGAGEWALVNAPEKPRGRLWLSLKERRIAWTWAAGASMWVSGVTAFGADPASKPGLATLAVLTGFQQFLWLKSRQIRPLHSKAADTEELSEQTKQLIAAWDQQVGMWGPDALKGSTIAAADEIKGGTVVLTVQLRHGVHSRSAVGNQTVQYLEVELGMGVDTVELEPVRENASLLKVTLTPTRELETISRLWEAPTLTDDGLLPMAVTNAGDEISIRVWGETGVRHLLVVGSSNAGKSNALNVVLPPGVLKRREVMFYCDGKGGTSGPKLAPIFDTVAVNREQVRGTFAMFSRIAEARKVRYGAMGIDEFDVHSNPDPIVTLVLEEATTIAAWIGPRLDAALQFFAREGRSLGFRLVICPQRPHLEGFPGGGDVRDQVMGANGSIIALKPGSPESAQISIGSTGEELDLTTLPAGGGWCATAVEGEVTSRKSRVLFLPDYKRLAEHYEGFTPRALEGEDLAAAGPAYAARMTGWAWAEEMVVARRRGNQPLGKLADLIPLLEARKAAAADAAAVEATGVTVDMTKGSPAGSDGNTLTWSDVAAILTPDQLDQLRISDAALASVGEVVAGEVIDQVADSDDVDQLAGGEERDPAEELAEELDEIAMYVVGNAPDASDAAERVRGAAKLSAEGKAARHSELLTALAQATPAGGITKAQLVDLLGVHEDTARGYLRELRNAGRVQVDKQHRWSLVDQQQAA
jgi:hypothetical protein